MGGGTEKRGGQTKIFKRGQAGSRGALKRERGWNLLTNYVNNKRKNIKEREIISVIKPWLEWRNQQKQSSKIVL